MNSVTLGCANYVLLGCSTNWAITLGLNSPNRANLICVAYPEVDKVSTDTVLSRRFYANNFANVNAAL